jgi:GNAT superfamily N-acetyltransferase
MTVHNVTDPQVSIRPALVAERGALEALQWRASLNNPGDRDALLANPDAIEIPAEQILRGLVFVAEVGSRTVGFASFLIRPDGDIDLDGLFVDPIEQRRGIGRALVDRAMAFAQAKGATALHVVGNPHAADFYLAAGFRRTGEVETRFGPGLLLQKKVEL